MVACSVWSIGEGKGSYLMSSKGVFILRIGRPEFVLDLNSAEGGIPHRKASMRIGKKLALNRANHEESKHTFLGLSLSLCGVLVWVRRWIIR